MKYKRLKVGQEYVPGWQYRYITLGNKSEWIDGVGCIGLKYSGGNNGMEVRIPAEPQPA